MFGEFEDQAPAAWRLNVRDKSMSDSSLGSWVQLSRRSSAINA